MFYKMVIAYNGSDFLGYQDNKAGPSIEGALRKALETALQHPVSLEKASRTDRGVHATGQVITFTTEKTICEKKLIQSINQLTPVTIAILSIEKTHPFHPSLDAKEKTYTYTIYNSPAPSPFHLHTSWHIPYPLNIPSMEKAAQVLIGTHNFQAFTQDQYDDYTRKIFSISITENNDFITIEIRGDSFMYKMVRNIVGSLVSASRDPSFNLEAVKNKKIRANAGMCAPAHGLVLKQINY